MLFVATKLGGCVSLRKKRTGADADKSRMKCKIYEKELRKLQIELYRLQD